MQFQTDSLSLLLEGTDRLAVGLELLRGRRGYLIIASFPKLVSDNVAQVL